MLKEDLLLLEPVSAVKDSTGIQIMKFALNVYLTARDV
jgi:hypothetical protein